MTGLSVFVAEHGLTEPQITEADGARTWLTCGANFVVAVSSVVAGSVLERTDNPDEAMVFLPDVGALIEAGGEMAEIDADSLAILPPGASRVVARGPGTIVRIFSSRAVDLYSQGVNAALYAAGGGDAAPLHDWPMPVGGYRLRVYRLADYAVAGTNMRVFSSRNLMINPLVRRDVPRDTTTLSPHSHTDFEQASLVLQGNYIHHVRYPWTPDMSTWRTDEHLEAGTPSVTIIPPKVIHTSRNVDAPGVLIDIFAPPRMDFARRGIICNAADYPMPQETVA